MSVLLPFLVIGLVNGSVYGMAAVGLVVSYKTSGVFNLAYGALATIAAYLFYFLHVQHGWAWPLAALVSVVALAVPVAWMLEQLGRRIARRPLVVALVATVGVLVLVEAACDLIYGSSAQQFPAFLPTSTFSVAGTLIQWQQLIIVCVSLAITGGLWAFLRFARLGKAMRAVVDSDELLAISGTSPALVRRLAWIIGCFTAALAGLLLAPSLTLDAEVLTLLVLQAFGGAAIGRFASLPGSWVGGMLIGVVASLLTKYLGGGGILGSLPVGLPFIALFLVLLIYRKRWIAQQERSVPEAVVDWSARPWLRIAVGLALLVFLASVPEFVGFHLTQWTTALTEAMLLLSLGLVVRSAREVSLCHVGFAAIGAVGFAKLVGPVHLPWMVALILGALIVVPIGAVLAIPAIRLSGLYLALATLGFGVLLQQMFYQSNWMFGQSAIGLTMPVPDVSPFNDVSGRGFYYLVLVVLVVVAALVFTLTHSRFGRILRGIGQSRLGLVTSGASVPVAHVTAFCVSAFFAGLAGALSGVSVGTVTGVNFDPMQSLLLVAVVAITPGGVPWSAIIGGALVSLLPSYFSGQTAADVLQMAFGLGAIGYGLGAAPHLPSRIRNWLAAKPSSGPAPGTAEVETSGARKPLAHTASRVPTTELLVRGATVSFGGNVALNDVSLRARSGAITGLIGPNGAGKTTMFNVCSGIITPAAGEIRLGELNLSGKGPAARARLGIGRTFQQVQLADSLSVQENVRLGVEAGLVGANPLHQLIASSGDRRLVSERADEAMSVCGISTIADVPVGSLPTGQRRLVELARALAGCYSILLLDEPSSGLDHAETAEFGRILRRVQAERAMGILLVEHDMSLVMDICDYIYVLDFGALIFEGSPAEVRNSPVVQAAYLGDADAFTAKGRSSAAH